MTRSSDGTSPFTGRVVMRTEAIELMEIEAMLTENGLSEDCRFALQGAAQALRLMFEADEWASPTQTFSPCAMRPLEHLSRTIH